MKYVNNDPHWFARTINDFFGIPINTHVVVSIRYAYLEIAIIPENKKGEYRYIDLSYDKILDVGAKTDKKIETTEKDKSVILRGVAGGVLFGPVGAVIGGMSGIGKKQKQKEVITNYLMIIYRSETTTGQIILANDFASPDNLVKLIKEKANLSEQWQGNTLII